MRMNDFHIQLATAYPGAEKVKTRKDRTLRAEIQTDQGVELAYIKLLSIEDIAKEALCAVLARKLHFPMKQPYYVNVSNIEDCAIGNIHNIAFGLQDDRMPSFKVSTPGMAIEDELNKWQELLRCAVFDEWIANHDRYPNNLFYEKNGLFWLIDHDEALPGYISYSSPANSQLLELKARDKSEFELYKIRDNSMQYVEEYKSIDWNEIYNLVRPEQLQGGDKYFKRHIEFLKDRIPQMRSIITQSLGIKQGEIPFTDQSRKSKETKK